MDNKFDVLTDNPKGDGEGLGLQAHWFISNLISSKRINKFLIITSTTI